MRSLPPSLLLLLFGPFHFTFYGAAAASMALLQRIAGLLRSFQAFGTAVLLKVGRVGGIRGIPPE